MTASEPPHEQYAVQLVGPGELRLNPTKAVPRPGPRQVLAKVEAVGLCFSDLKLLKQFSGHARKSAVLEGLDAAVLNEIPSYVPGPAPTVPGHEVVCRIVAVGGEVKSHRLGERCLVQTDYRTLRTAGSNAAFGYNFEGGLQEYVLMDERVVMDPESGERFLIPVRDDLGASTVALVEPWACVENSYANPERTGIKPGSRLLIVAHGSTPEGGPVGLFAGGLPANVTAVGLDSSSQSEISRMGVAVEPAGDVASLPGGSFDDIIYFGADRATIETINDKIAPGGIVNIVTCGRKVGERASIGIGRVHYGLTRWVGTQSSRAVESYEHIPATGEIRPGDRIVVIGAGGPMGQMHVIRNICQGVPGISIVGTDIDDGRLEALAAKARPLAEANHVPLDLINSTKAVPAKAFSYHAVLVPVGNLVAEAVDEGLEGSIINIFAGIPAATREAIDLDAYIGKRCYMFGTSGSVVRDMKIVLEKVEKGRLATDCSVDAVSGMAGAQEGLTAVEHRTLAGKIIVYPSLHRTGLIPLTEMADRFPSVAAKLGHGQWNRAAEEEFLRVAEG